MIPHNLYTIGTRGSALALAQAYQIKELLEKAHRTCRFEIKIIKTTGDKRQDLSLTKVTQSTKGLFTKELEVALLRRKIDLAVHSLKDLPTDLPGGLILGAVTKREDAGDYLITKSPGGLKALPSGSTVATSSLRRKVQLQFARPDLQIVEIRGNVETRLEKLCENPEIHALMLACAGMNRLGYRFVDGKLDATKIQRSQSEISRIQNPWVAAGGPGMPPARAEVLYGERLPVEMMLPAVGQAAIGIETRDGDERVAGLMEKISHFATLHAVMAERSFLRALGGGCQVPLAAHAQCAEGKLHLQAVVFDPDGTHRRAGEKNGDAKEGETLGAELATELK
ncbi:MAG: hydroxymethylbilane synthase [Verrucomicrobiae bacterium]|nr:hydroxymethylbilane synthase [Verrucomicrobiae bacterium]